MKWFIRIVVFGGLAILVLIGLAVSFFSGSPCSSREDLAKVFVTETMGTPLDTYKANTGSYPTTLQGFKALLVASPGVTNWKGPYLTCKDVPLDPWGTPYHYRFPGLHNPATYDLWSLGPDKLDNTADDIHNW
jgi:general secretion pathway protein G